MPAINYIKLPLPAASCCRHAGSFVEHGGSQTSLDALIERLKNRWKNNQLHAEPQKTLGP